LDENFSRLITTFDEVPLLSMPRPCARDCAPHAPAACRTRVLT